MHLLLSMATAGDVMLKILYIIIAFLILMFMITIHELGHYCLGKLLKFKIREFAIGMGPKLFSRTNKTTGEIFSIRAIPLGGFCAFEGEDEDVENPDAFNNQKPWKRLIVLFAGAFFNFVSALLIGIILFGTFGENLPNYNYRVVLNVFEYSVNYEQDNTLESGDVILSIDGHSLFDELGKPISDDEFAQITASVGDISTFEVFRPNDGITRITDINNSDQGQVVTLNNVRRATYTTDIEGVDEEYTGWGISLGYYTYHQTYGFFGAIGRSFSACGETATLVLKTLGGLITGVVGLDEVGGPITTISIATQVIEMGFASVLYLIVLISVNLAVFNLLPVPALDGCRMVFVIIEWIRGKPVNRKIEGWVHFIGIMLLLAFVVLIDVLKWF
ncbi:MAG: site-2 protease family protein [Clostridia bacterium]|nr:site-2 protease family protein [Clostridia bacterium]